MKPVTFNLQIFAPGDADDPPLSINSSTPFMQFQRGDLFNPRYGRHFDHLLDELAGTLLCIVKVEHGIQELEGGDEMEACIRHYVRVYTEAVPDDEGARKPA